MRSLLILLVSGHIICSCLAADGATNSTECKDTVDYCWTEPDENCFGIYEPWAQGHCPMRCGFCPEKPPCEDKLDYCSQFSSSSCVDPSFISWARLNCRKTCQLCAVPSRPNTTAGPNSGTTAPAVVVNPVNPVSPSNNPVSTPTVLPVIPGTGNANVTIPQGTLTGGSRNTFVIQGPKSIVDGTCYYKSEVFQQDKNWYDGCDYVCNCLNAKRNLVICTDRCTSWQDITLDVDGCSWVQESGNCCQRLECQVD